MFLSKQLFRNVLASLVIFTHSVNCTGSEGLIHDRDIIKDHEILSANNSNNSTNKNSSDGSDSADSLKDKKPHTLAHNTVKMQNDLIHNRSSVRTNITPDDAYDKLCETYLIPYTNWNDKKMVDSRVATLEKSICEEAVYQEFDPYVATEYVCGFEMLYSKYKYEQNFLRDNINIETQEYLDAFNACYYTIKYDFKWLRSVKAHRSWVLTKVSTNDDILNNKELFTAYVALINSDMDILNNFGKNCLIEKLSIYDSSLLNKSYCTVVVENWIYELFKLPRTIVGKTNNLKNTGSEK